MMTCPAKFHLKILSYSTPIQTKRFQGHVAGYKQAQALADATSSCKLKSPDQTPKTPIWSTPISHFKAYTTFGKESFYMDLNTISTSEGIQQVAVFLIRIWL